MFNVANMSFNVIRENNILAKIYEFTVCVCESLSLISILLPFSLGIIGYGL